ncbi:ATP-dependent zinc metalloprotease FtsH [Cryptosporangium minutisporangium]|uniref:ATP-dependent zinc metalloprotease FtsH n=1 Tax=Cryptosporangium minutisporangium TaxID=113569 RepID=A0ABP6T766_9ACTN
MRWPAPPPRGDPAAPDSKPWWKSWGPLLAVLALAGLLLWMSARADQTTTVAYSEFAGQVRSGKVAAVTISEDGGVTGRYTNGDLFRTQLPTALGVADLDAQLLAKNVEVDAVTSSGWGPLPLLLLPAVIIGVIVWLRRRSAAGGPTGRAAEFGRAKATVILSRRPTTRFADVAGYQGVKQEITEVVDYLRAPARFAALGATGPRGVLMVGPPGTGKTLLARAVAGEAQVPFLSITGSEFVEMYVGVGASRVRDLFAEAKKNAPSIVFIDEIDAMGSRRGGRSSLFGNDEREQTLNQLLAAMDGFEKTTDVVVLAATNQPEALDAALLRPGRFDRQVLVPLPNQRDREAILRVHARGKKIAPDVALDRVARATPGFSGADLANLLNEAAIAAVRAGRTTVTTVDLDDARDRVLLGRRDGSTALLPEEQRWVAVHESGHALVAALCRRTDPVTKVTILPAGASLGVTQQLPEVERHLYREGYLLDQLAVRSGGRAAELLVFDEASSGAADDLAVATALARRMVSELGLSPVLGPISCAPGARPESAADEPWTRPYAEATQQKIDDEVTRLLREAEARATALLRAHRPALDHLVADLIEHETVDGQAVATALAAVAEGESR